MMGDLKKVLLASSIGWVLILSIIIGIILGYLLDKKLHTFPFFFILFMILGIISGIKGNYNIISRIFKD